MATQADEGASADVLSAAAALRPAAEWRQRLAERLLEETRAELVAVFTCAPARPLDAEQAVVPPERTAVVDDLFDRFLGRIERGSDGTVHLKEPARAFAPLEAAANKKLADQVRREVWGPAGIAGLIMAAFVDQTGAVIGWVAVGSGRPSRELLSRWGGALTQVAAVASRTLQAALDLAQAVGAYAQSADPELRSLSDREREIVHAICSGQGDEEVARALAISEQTVGSHLKRIYKKLGVHSRVELASRAGRLRLPARPR